MKLSTRTSIAAGLVAAFALVPASAAFANPPIGANCKEGETALVVHKVNGNEDTVGDKRYVCAPAPVPGPTGAPGAVGPQGPAGADGAVGATGGVGPAGATGGSGPAGADGATGAVGPQGEKGNQGNQGNPGEKGDTGAQGIQGLKGDTGFTGEVGPKGDKGDQGIPGLGITNVFTTLIPFGSAGCNGAGGLNINVSYTNETTVLIGSVCNGERGEIGLTGANGEKGKNGVTKTVIVHEDGKTEVIDVLPATGSNDATPWLAALGAVAVLGGAAAVWKFRK